MKKVVYVLLLLMFLLLTACMGQASLDRTAVLDATNAGNGKTAENRTAVSLNATDCTDKASLNQNDPASNILVKTPITISDNLIEYKEISAHLRLKMISGKYYEDWNPGAIMGTIWEGRFIFELCDEFGKTLVQTDLGKYYTEVLIFTDHFKLEFDDYNNDGNMDFTLGQYASSNGRVYKLFTLKKDGTVEQLEIKDTPELFISDSANYYSTKLHKFDNTAFKARYYDNSQGKNYESIYKWQAGEFVNIDKREIISLEGYYEIMSDTSIKPEEMLAYIRENIRHSMESDAANLALRLELLQRDYQDQLVDRYNNGDFIASELEKLYQNDTILISFNEIEDVRLRELLTDIRNNGFKLVRIEGGLYPIIDYSIYKEFSLYLPEDLRSYFTLMAVESDQIPAMDAGLVIRWDEVVSRTLAQEQFIQSYDNSQKWIEVKMLFKKYIRYVFYGLPNTPDYTYETKIMDPQLKKILLEVSQTKGNTPLEKTISDYIQVLSRSKYKLTDEVERFRENAVETLIE